MKILIVEDNEDNRRLAKKRLQASGHGVLEAVDGAEALLRLREAHPDLVLLDLQLPDMDGLQVLEHIRADPDLAQTVVVACTAFAMASDRQRSLEAGCDAYLSKPVNIRALSDQLQEIWDGVQK